MSCHIIIDHTACLIFQHLSSRAALLIHHVYRRKWRFLSYSAQKSWKSFSFRSLPRVATLEYNDASSYGGTLNCMKHTWVLPLLNNMPALVYKWIQLLNLLIISMRWVVLVCSKRRSASFSFLEPLFDVRHTEWPY